MYCLNCGRQIPEGSYVCSYCGQRQSSRRSAGGYSSPPGTHNIFSALVHQKAAGTVMEFVLWCVTCVDVLLSLIASIMSGNIIWILLMMLSIGLGVIMAFRLKPLAMLYGAVGVFLIINGIHFIGYAYYSAAASIVLFVLEILVALGVTVCAFIHFFSRINLGNVLTILVIVNTGMAMLRQIVMYASAGLFKWGLRYTSYWFGTICLWIIMIVVLLLYIFFFWGAIDSRKGKIPRSLNPPDTVGGRVAVPVTQQQVNAGLRGLTGVYAGQTIFLQGRTVTLGSSSQMMIVLQAPYVSGQHCAIRYNNVNGYYEIFDNSRNGVHLRSGKVLQKGVYNVVSRGEVISIGSNEQQFLLL